MELLQTRGELTQEQEELLPIISDGANHILNLVQDALARGPATGGAAAAAAAPAAFARAGPSDAPVPPPPLLPQSPSSADGGATFRLSPRKADLWADVVEKAWTAVRLQPRNAEHAARLRMEIRILDTLPKKVVIDAERARQVLQNLLLNAVKFTPEARRAASFCRPPLLAVLAFFILRRSRPPADKACNLSPAGGGLTLPLRSCCILSPPLVRAPAAAQGGSVIMLADLLEPDLLRLRVQDSGRGLTPEGMARIFQVRGAEPELPAARAGGREGQWRRRRSAESRSFPPPPSPALAQPFSQAEDDTNAKFGGSGLGLCVSRSIALAMGGDLTVRSAGLGHGAEFTVTMRLVLAASGADSGSGNRQRGGGGARSRRTSAMASSAAVEAALAAAGPSLLGAAAAGGSSSSSASPPACYFLDDRLADLRPLRRNSSSADEYAAGESSSYFAGGSSEEEEGDRGGRGGGREERRRRSSSSTGGAATDVIASGLAESSGAAAQRQQQPEREREEGASLVNVLVHDAADPSPPPAARKGGAWLAAGDSPGAAAPSPMHDRLASPARAAIAAAAAAAARARPRAPQQQQVAGESTTAGSSVPSTLRRGQRSASPLGGGGRRRGGGEPASQQPQLGAAPSRLAAAAAASAAAPPPPQQPPRPVRALVAEDDALVRRVMNLAIRQAGIEARFVADGLEATGVLSADPTGYDLVMLDGHMVRTAVVAAPRRRRPACRLCSFLFLLGYAGGCMLGICRRLL